MMLEKGATAGMWEHMESDHLCQVLLSPAEHSWPYRQVAAACLVVFTGSSSFTHRLKSKETPISSPVSWNITRNCSGAVFLY